MKDIICTGAILDTYMKENNITIHDVAEASHVSERTVYRAINDQSRLPINVAEGINKLLPEVKVDFLMSYDARYQVQKRTYTSENNISNIDQIIEFFKLKKLFPEFATNKFALFNHAKEIIGLENLLNYRINNSPFETVNFSLAQQSDKNASFLWLYTAYKERTRDTSSILEFNKKAFDERYKDIKKYAGVTSKESALYAISSLLRSCGINFLFRKSIPNSRIKGAVVKDTNGHIFLFLSDLFKSVENLMLSFYHECNHIYNEDYNSVNNEENEKFINEETINKFISSDLVEDFINNKKNVFEVAEAAKSPVNIIAEILRFKTNNYKDTTLNNLVHHYQ